MAKTTDPILSWPLWLPALLRTDYEYEPKDISETTESELTDIKRRRYTTDETTVKGTAVFTHDQLQFFESFEKHLLKSGTVWFMVPLYTSWGTTYHKVRLKGRPKYGKIFGEDANAGMYVTLTFEMAERKMLTEDETILIYEIGLENIYQLYSRLHHILHVQMPGTLDIPPEYYGMWIWVNDDEQIFYPAS